MVDFNKKLKEYEAVKAESKSIAHFEDFDRRLKAALGDNRVSLAPVSKQEKIGRVPLANRTIQGAQWTPEESALFNSITKLVGRGYIFSKRLRLAQAMLDALDAECIKIDAEG